MAKIAKKTEKTVAPVPFSGAPAPVANAEPKRDDFRNFVGIGFAYGKARSTAVETFHAVAGETSREYARDCFKVGYLVSRLYPELTDDSEAQGWRIFSAAPWKADNSPAAGGRQRRTEAEQRAYLTANQAWSTISRAEESIGKVSTRGRKEGKAEKPEAGPEAAPVAALSIGAMATTKDATVAATAFRDEFMAFTKAVRSQVPDVSPEADALAATIYGMLNRYAILVSGK